MYTCTHACTWGRWWPTCSSTWAQCDEMLCVQASQLHVHVSPREGFPPDQGFQGFNISFIMPYQRDMVQVAMPSFAVLTHVLSNSIVPRSSLH